MYKRLLGSVNHKENGAGFEYASTLHPHDGVVVDLSDGLGWWAAGLFDGMGWGEVLDVRLRSFERQVRWNIGKSQVATP